MLTCKNLMDIQILKKSALTYPVLFIYRRSHIIRSHIIVISENFCLSCARAVVPLIPRTWNRSSPYNPPTGYTMISSHGGWDTGAKKRGASQTSQSQIKDKDPKKKSMVSVKAFSPHRFSGIMFWMEKYEGPTKPNTWTYSHAPECSSQLISNSNTGS